MDNLGILPTLTKDYILSKITQEQIFEYYLNIKVETEVLLVTPSVIRTGDNNPTFSFKYSNNGKLRARDWAGYFWGDCFDLVAHVLRLNSKDKKSFNVILNQIAKDFRIHKYSDKNYIHSGNVYDTREAVKNVKEKTTIQFTPRQWDRFIDGKFWLAGNINSKLLDKGKVYPCQYIWVNNNLRYMYNPKDRAYAYMFTPSDIKIYYPDREEYRFISNTSYLQGIDLLEVSKFGIITKSYKDVLSLLSFGIYSVAPSSETNVLTAKEWEKIRYYADTWFSLMDFDRTGILMARKLRKLYNIRPLFFPRYLPLNKSLRNDVKGLYQGNKLASNFPYFTGVKDFYDFVSIYGIEETKKLINATSEHFETLIDEDDISKEMYEDLKWLKNR